LERADTLGLVNDFSQVLNQLKASGFFVAESLEQQLLQRHRARQEQVREAIQGSALP